VSEEEEYSSVEEDISNSSLEKGRKPNIVVISSGEDDDNELIELYNIISGIESPGTFACGGTLNAVNPGKQRN